MPESNVLVNLIKLKIHFFIIFCFAFISPVISQDSFNDNNPAKDFESFAAVKKTAQKLFSLDKFSIGVSGGINFSQVIPLEKSSIFSSSDLTPFEKDYKPFYRNFGSQFGFILDYNFSKIFSLGIHPSFINYTYGYKNTYQWTGNTNLTYEADIKHHLSFFEIPLILGFHTTFKKWQPYYQGGVFYSAFKGSHTDFSVVETSPNLSGSNQTINYNTSINSSDQYAKNHFGLIGGVGISYIGGGVKVGLEANIRFFMSNLNSIESRYQNNVVVSGNYDVPDRFKFSNLSLNLNIHVPLVCHNQSSKGGSLFCE